MQHKYSLFFILFTSILCLLITSVSATNYYINATSGSDSLAGTTPATAWKTISKVNSVVFNPGDNIYFERGQTWREQLSVAFSTAGNSTSPVIFSFYGNGPQPIIDGSNLITGWNDTGSNVWNASVTTQPKQVFFNGTRGTVVNYSGVNGTNKWNWSNNVLYVYSTSDPDTAYTMEASQRTYGILLDTNNYITISNIDIRKTNQDGIGTFTSTGVVINGTELSYNYEYGINEWRASGSEVVNITNNTIHDNGGSGMEPNSLNSSLISGNIAYNNDILEIETIHNWGAGIKLVGSRNTNNIVEHNIAYLNGHGVTGAGGDSQDRAGIWLDTVGTGNIVRYNIAYSNLKYGIFNEATNGSIIYYNIAYNNTEVGNARGILVGRGSSNNVVYNNIVYGNRIGLAAEGDGVGNSGLYDNNTFKNNIAFGNIVQQFRAFLGGENDGVNGIGNVYLYNSFGPEATNFIGWGFSTNKSTYSSWETASGNCGSTGCSHSVQSDPLFTNASNNDFTLQHSSPAIDAGTNVSLTTDYAGNPVPRGAAPDIGAYEYQSSGGTETYYVNATTGSDSNNGLSPANPWQTIAKVNSMTFNPGDNIYFERGQTWRETLTVPSSGNATAQITFGAYGNVSAGAPIINGENTTNVLILLNGKSYINISALNLTNSTAATIFTNLGGSQYITIQGNEISFSGQHGIQINSNYSTITNNNIHNVTYNGINIDGGDNDIISNNDIYNWGYYSESSGWSGVNIYCAPNFCSNISVSNNTIHDGYSTGIGATSVNNMTLEYNDIFGVLNDNLTGGGVLISSRIPAT